MEKIETYFFDTYAFYEIIEGNKDYEKYNEVSIVTTKMNLMELHYGLLIKRGKEEADKIYYRLLKFAIDIEDNIIILANEFRASMKKRKLSYIDCLGYVIARSNNIKFLTGDKEFKYLENVEFIK
ncbi:MAG TPA: PIN domain-containing protein [Candidatus Nanoarchaeia archaeon]|nr:PIN domain-containing protein [Candidatus Nanoarchaeia archaeon]